MVSWFRYGLRKEREQRDDRTKGRKKEMIRHYERGERGNLERNVTESERRSSRIGGSKTIWGSVEKRTSRFNISVFF